MSYAGSDRDHDDLLVESLVGAVAGVVGLWALDRVDWALYEREDPAAQRRLRQARPHGLDPAHNIARTVAGLFGRELDRQPNPAGIAVHYGLGVSAAMGYAALRNRFPAVKLGGGSLFGALLWLAQDEGLNALLGTSGKPQDYPLTTHLRGLAAHLVFGITTEMVLRLRPGRTALPA